jgi:nicotinamidase-related amidase
MVATQHNKNMVATKHGSSTKHGTNITEHRQQHKGQEGRDNNKSHKAATTVCKSVHESLNEEIEIKLSSLSGFCSLFQSLVAAN